MDCNFLSSSIEHDFHYPALSVTWRVGIADNFPQIVDSWLGLKCDDITIIAEECTLRVIQAPWT